jgi:AraC-like DNA-binding protein
MVRRVDCEEPWEGWRRRLRELRLAVEAHLDAADALATQAACPAARARAGTSEDRSARMAEVAVARGETRAATQELGATAPVLDAGTPTPARVEHSAHVRRALDYLAAHDARPVSLAQLAKVAGCGRDRLARAFRRETGTTVQAHLRRLRLARAAREVGEGDKIEAVMLGVGYRGKRNFYRQFKARFGMTPGRYRVEVTRGRREGEQGGASRVKRE